MTSTRRGRRPGPRIVLAGMLLATLTSALAIAECPSQLARVVPDADTRTQLMADGLQVPLTTAGPALTPQLVNRDFIVEWLDAIPVTYGAERLIPAPHSRQRRRKLPVDRSVQPSARGKFLTGHRILLRQSRLPSYAVPAIVRHSGPRRPHAAARSGSRQRSGAVHPVSGSGRFHVRHQRLPGRLSVRRDHHYHAGAQSHHHVVVDSAAGQPRRLPQPFLSALQLFRDVQLLLLRLSLLVRLCASFSTPTDRGLLFYAAAGIYRVMVRMLVSGYVPKRHRVIRRLLQLPARKHSRGIMTG